MDFINHRSTANFKFSLSATDEKLRITNDGDVGIGVSNPSTKLEVDGVITTAGLTTTANINFGDNDKAIFGAGSDLQIYHDGTYNFINAASGQFIFMQADELRLRSSTSETYFAATLNGATTLYHDASAKLSTTSTGIDVTGTVTSDGLTVDGNAQISSSVPVLKFMQSDGTDKNAQLRLNSNSFYINQLDDDGSTNRPVALFNVATGDISFYEDTGTTAKLFWDASAESLGIGTSSISTSKLHLQGTTGTASAVRVESTAADSDAYYIADNDGSVWTWGIDGGASDSWILSNAFGLGTPKMTVTTGGNVGIGTSSPSTPLHVQGSDTASSEQLLSLVNGGGNTGAGARLWLSGTNATTRGTYIEGQARSTGNNHDLIFATSATSAAPSERMRLDFNGNLLVGTTNSTHHTGSTTQGITLSKTFHGLISASRSGAQPLILNRQTSDGTIADFRKDGTSVGSVSVTASATAYNTSSDQRLKENIVDAPSASDDIDAIQVRSFDWKADGSHQKYGMVAQELQTVAPDAVTEGDTEEDMMAVDYSKLVPMLVKEIQSLRARVAQLEGEN